MSSKTNDRQNQPPPETRSERVMKYGANVALTCVVVVLLAGIVVWGAERYHKRTYMDSSAEVHLTPQSIKIVSDLQKPIRIVGLYARLKPEAAAANQQDFYQPVADLLDEYKSNGNGKIEVEMIDPVTDPAKLDVWLGHVIEKYGGDVAGYRKFLSEFPVAFKDVHTAAINEGDRVQQMIKAVAQDSTAKPGKEEGLTQEDVDRAFKKFKNPRQFQQLIMAVGIVGGLADNLDQIDKAIKPELEKKLPDYKAAVNTINTNLTVTSKTIGQVITVMTDIAGGSSATMPSSSTSPTTKPDNSVPPLARDYARRSIPRLLAMKKAVDDQLDKIKKLGELKLDKVREKLTSVDESDSASTRTIAVEGPDDIRVIAFKDAWRAGGGAGLRRSNLPIRYRFAGEQEITTSILSLTTPKTQVAFIHSGGSSKLTPAPRDQRAGMFSEIADRLRSYNFDVKEEDLAPPQPQNQFQPPPPPANLEEVKDAVWVVFDEPAFGQFGPQPPDPTLAEKVRQHLDAGKSVFVLTQGWSALRMQLADEFYNMLPPTGSPPALDGLLKEYGVEVRGNLVAVHEKIGDADEDESEDFVERARRNPPIFVLNDFGDSPVTTPVYALDAALVPLQPVVETSSAPADAKVTHILPIPTDPKSWGESDVDSIRSDNVSFDPKTGDLASPIYGGAIVEKKDKGRLIVIGNSDFVANYLLDLPDPRIRREREQVARFPGNGELFTNGIFWLAHQDNMIALSPASMDTPRVRKMGDFTLNFWRYGVVVAGLPILAILCGLLVWNNRRE